MSETVPLHDRKDKPSDESLQLAAQCWCDETTKDRVLDPELAFAFAKRLDTVIAQEKARLTVLVATKREVMTVDYKNTIKHTGGLLTASMGYAYAKGLNDALKLLTKDTDEKPV